MPHTPPENGEYLKSLDEIEISQLYPGRRACCEKTTVRDLGHALEVEP